MKKRPKERESRTSFIKSIREAEKDIKRGRTKTLKEVLVVGDGLKRPHTHYGD